MELIGNMLFFVFDIVLMKAVFPTTVLLIIFSFKNIKYSKKNKLFIFYIVAMFVVILVRLIFGVLLGGGRGGGWICEARRFFAVGTIVIPFAVFGFPLLVKYTYYLINKRKFKFHITLRKIIIFWILLFSIICIGKALSPQSYKAYYHEPNMIIESNTPEGSQTLLLASGVSDYFRKRFYIKTDKHLKIERILDTDNPVSFIKEVKKYVRKNYDVFVYINNRNNEFENIFKSKELRFPFKELKQWKKGEYTLYKYEK